VRRYPYPHPFAAGTIGELASSVGTGLLGGKGAACAEMVDRATKPAKLRTRTKRTDINVRDVFITDLSRLSLIPVERVKVVGLPSTSPLFHCRHGVYPWGASTPVLGSARRGDARSGATAARSQLFRRFPAVAKKSESEKRKTHLFSGSARYARANPSSPSDPAAGDAPPCYPARGSRLSRSISDG
jgi:hypothetical protein